MIRALSTLLAIAAVSVPRATPPAVIKQVVIYSEAGRYGGWPANHGIWMWGNEVLLGFESGYFKYTETTHSIDFHKPSVSMQARSLDGGLHWTLETPANLEGPKGAVNRFPSAGPQPVDFTGRMNFRDPNFAFTARTANFDYGPSRFYYSTDRGRTWLGPYKLPDFGLPGIAARTDILINGKHDATLLLTAASADRREGGVICVRTRDGGRSWKLLSQVTERDPSNYAIMPSSVRLSKSVLITAIRRPKSIEVYRSNDDGTSWKLIAKPCEDVGSNPPSLVRLKDGRLVLTFGYRKKPYGIRAKFSADDGGSWSEDIILRADGGSWDLGYPRTIERPDGSLLTAYYFEEATDRERTIQATLWSPGDRASTQGAARTDH